MVKAKEEVKEAEVVKAEVKNEEVKPEEEEVKKESEDSGLWLMGTINFVGLEMCRLWTTI